MLDPNNYVEMRKWLSQYVSKLDIKPMNKWHWPEIEISISDIPVEYGAGDCFSLRIYVPFKEYKAPRPVPIAIHGGGWAIGLSEPAHDRKLT